MTNLAKSRSGDFQLRTENSHPSLTFGLRIWLNSQDGYSTAAIPQQFPKSPSFFTHLETASKRSPPPAYSHTHKPLDAKQPTPDRTPDNDKTHYCDSGQQSPDAQTQPQAVIHLTYLDLRPSASICVHLRPSASTCVHHSNLCYRNDNALIVKRCNHQLP
jgi:hypothetical protein